MASARSMPRALGRVGTVAAGLVVLLGAVGAAYAVGLLGAPGVVAVDNRFAGVNATTTTVATDLTVDNPNPVGANVSDVEIEYTVWLNDVDLADGTKSGVELGTGNTTVSFTTSLANERIPAWWTTHIRNDEHTVMRVDATVSSGLLGRDVEVTPVERPIETDILSAFNSTETRPIDANAPLIEDPVLYVNETAASWGSVSRSTTPIDMTFRVYNPKPAPYTITEIAYTITMNDITVGEGETARGHVIPPRSEETIAATTAIRNERLDEWWVSHLERDQVTTLRIEFVATIELAGGQSIEVPLEALTYTETIETDFFDNKAGARTADGDGTPTPTGAGSEGGQSPATTDTATAGGSPTPTTVPTPTPTPTPDDGLPIGNGTTTGLL